jgi:4-hydroxy-tetrahydrodipicolinate reductase
MSAGAASGTQMRTKVIVCGAGGRMGRTIVGLLAQHPEARLAATVEAPASAAVGRDAGEVAGVGSLGVVIGADLGAVAGRDTVILDFTTAAAAVEHLHTAVERGSAIVIGTTGFTPAQQAQVDGLAARTRSVIEPNMSVGIAVLRQLAGEAGRALGTDFDPEIVELHHRQKVDAPSGTALALARSVAEATGRDADLDLVSARHGIIGPRPQREIGVMALRGGDIIGDHTVIFAGMGERIELTHRAQSRECLARGAIRAAVWIVGQPVGRYGMADVLGWRQSSWRAPA